MAVTAGTAFTDVPNNNSRLFANCAPSDEKVAKQKHIVDNGNITFLLRRRRVASSASKSSSEPYLAGGGRVAGRVDGRQERPGARVGRRTRGSERGVVER